MELTRIKSFHPDQMGPLFLGGNTPFFPAEPESARNACDRGACRGCGRPDTPEVDRQCRAGLRMAVAPDRFRDHDLRIAGPAVGSACGGDRADRYIFAPIR